MSSKLNTIEDITKAAGTMREVYYGSRCACGCGGSWSNYVSGSIGGKPAIWMGCARENGRAVGGGLTDDDYHVAHAVLNACRKLDVDICEIFDDEAEVERERKEAAESRRHNAMVARMEHNARRKQRELEYASLLNAALAKCHIDSNGKPNKTEADMVRRAYGKAIGFGSDYEYKQSEADGYRDLVAFAEHGPSQNDRET